MDAELEMGHEIFLVNKNLATSRTSVFELAVWNLENIFTFYTLYYLLFTHYT